MELAYFGFSCFRFKFGNTTVFTDPFDSKEVGLSLDKQEGDIVVWSEAESDIKKGARDRVSVSEDRDKKGGELVEIFEPGEYEIGGVFVRSYADPVFHLISAGEVNLCYIGPVKAQEMKVNFDDLPDVDYLIVPVGDGDMFSDWKAVGDLIKNIDPAVVIPSCYKMDGMKSPYDKLKGVDEFLKEFAGHEVEATKKLKLQHKARAEDAKFDVEVLAKMG